MSMTLNYSVNVVLKSKAMFHVKKVITSVMSAAKAKTFFFFAKSARFSTVVLLRGFKQFDCFNWWIFSEILGHSGHTTVMNAYSLVILFNFFQIHHLELCSWLKLTQVAKLFYSDYIAMTLWSLYILNYSLAIVFVKSIFRLCNLNPFRNWLNTRSWKLV